MWQQVLAWCYCFHPPISQHYSGETLISCRNRRLDWNDRVFLRSRPWGCNVSEAPVKRWTRKWFKIQKWEPLDFETACEIESTSVLKKFLIRKWDFYVQDTIKLVGLKCTRICSRQENCLFYFAKSGNFVYFATKLGNFVLFCQVRQFCLFRIVRQFRLFRQVRQFCWPAIFFISPSPAVLFRQDRQIRLICWVRHFLFLFLRVPKYCFIPQD